MAFVDARHGAHARVEDRVRCGKDTGLGRFRSRDLAIKAAWLNAAMIAADLLAWAQSLHSDLAKAEPKKLRYRLVRAASRLTRGGRQPRLRIDRHWPWATDLRR